MPNFPPDLMLEAAGLMAQRGHRILFADLDLSVRGGAGLLVEGPNGCGKTTLLRILAGLSRPKAGSLRVRADGKLAAHPEDYSGLVAWAGHADGARAAMSAEEQALFWRACASGKGRLAAATHEEALRRFGLWAVRAVAVGRLSAGQRRRLALTRLLTDPRPIWLLDEPTAALDSDGKALLLDLARQHCAHGGLIVAASHETLDLPNLTRLRVDGGKGRTL